MSWPIGMPNLGHTMDEGLVQEWLKQVGDPVRAGDVIAIVESDKASFDIESPADGVLLAIDVAAGAKAPVGARIGLVGLVGQAGEAVAAAPVAAAAAVQPAPPAAQAAGGASARARLRVSPAARALAEEHGIALDDIDGSGDDGMITRDDVRARVAALWSGAPAAPVAGRRQPLSPMRAAIAAATQASWQSIPHVALHSRANIDALSETTPLTAAVVRAAALALRDFPCLNGWLHADGFEPAAGADIGLAVSTDGGLLTAVVRAAHDKAVPALDAEIHALARSAREGSLAGAQTLGASFTVSSLGRWGVDHFAPLIVAPQVAILGVGRVDLVARPDDRGGVRFCKELPLTLVFDHRANDGVMAARLLAAIVANLAQPEQLEAA